MASVHQKQPAPSVIASAPSGMAEGLAGMLDLGLSVLESSARPAAPSRVNKARNAQTVFIRLMIAGCAAKANIPFIQFHSTPPGRDCASEASRRNTKQSERERAFSAREIPARCGWSFDTAAPRANPNWPRG